MWEEWQRLFQKMFACKTKFHRHRRKLMCQILKMSLMIILVTLLATHTLLIKQLESNSPEEQDHNLKNTKGKNNFKESKLRHKISLHSQLWIVIICTNFEVTLSNFASE